MDENYWRALEDSMGCMEVGRASSPSGLVHPPTPHARSILDYNQRTSPHFDNFNSILKYW